MTIALCIGCLVVVTVLVRSAEFPEQQFALERQSESYHVDQLRRPDGKGCGTSPTCERVGGKCQSLKNECDGTLHRGQRYCKRRSCGCCIPPVITLPTINITFGPPITFRPIDKCMRLGGFWIPFYEYSCPCPYYGAVEVYSRPGGICCRASECPNGNFTSMHVCGRDDSASCRNSADALDFARRAWPFPDEIRYPYVFSCQDIKYKGGDDVCRMDFVQTWECLIELERVVSCHDIGLCSVESWANNGTIIPGSLRCLF